MYADLLGYQYKRNPKQSRQDEEVTLIERSDFRAGGGNYADWSVTLRPFCNYLSRVNSIRNYRNLVRTVEFEISVQGVYGDLPRVADFAADRLEELTWLSSFIQGIVPSAPKLELRDGRINTDGASVMYVKLRNLHGNIGSSCEQKHLLFSGPIELRLFLDRAYESFLTKQDSLQLEKVLGLYIDSLDPQRPLENKFVNLCMAMEMLANRYSSDRGSTPAQIRTLVNRLDVEFLDIIPAKGSLELKYHPHYHPRHDKEFRHNLIELEKSATSTTQMMLQKAAIQNDRTLQYFWYNARNQVVHGGSNISFEELMMDYHALLVLLRRLLRKILVADDLKGLRGLQRLDPDETISL